MNNGFTLSKKCQDAICYRPNVQFRVQPMFSSPPFVDFHTHEWCWLHLTDCLHQLSIVCLYTTWKIITSGLVFTVKDKPTTNVRNIFFSQKSNHEGSIYSSWSKWRLSNKLIHGKNIIYIYIILIQKQNGHRGRTGRHVPNMFLTFVFIYLYGLEELFVHFYWIKWIIIVTYWPFMREWYQEELLRWSTDW